MSYYTRILIINLFTRTSKTTVRLDNAPGEESCVSTALTISWKRDRQRAKKIAFGASLVGYPKTKLKILGIQQDFRLKEPAHVSTGREWEPDDTNKTLGLRQLCRNQFVAPVIP